MKVYFAKSHYAVVRVVQNRAEAKKIIKEYGKMQACCEFNHRTKSRRKATLIFIKKWLTPAIVVHECVHAAANWVCEYEMKHAPKNASDDHLRDHYEEALARVVESLCEQVWEKLGLTTKEF